MPFGQLIRENHNYHPAFCEENIWHLCQQPSLLNSYVVFIVSKGEAFPMLHQQASEHPLTPIFWDYHVVLLHLSKEQPKEQSEKNKTKQNKIIDFDTSLGFCTDIATYFKESFVEERFLTDEEVPLFRLVPAKEFVASFCSDRSHMQSPLGWLAPPPTWPLIGNSKNNLSDFIEASENGVGELLSYDAVLERFSCSPHESRQ